MSEYDRLKAQKDAILANEREKMRKELIDDPAPSQPVCSNGFTIKQMDNRNWAIMRGSVYYSGPYPTKRDAEDHICALVNPPPAPSQPAEPRILTAADIERIGEAARKDVTCQRCGTGGPILRCGGTRDGCGCDCHHTPSPPAVPQATAPTPAARLSDAEIALKHFPPNIERRERHYGDPRDDNGHPYSFDLNADDRNKCVAALAERGRQDAERIAELEQTNKQHLESIVYRGKQIAALTAKVEELERDKSWWKGKFNEIVQTCCSAFNQRDALTTKLAGLKETLENVMVYIQHLPECTAKITGQCVCGMVPDKKAAKEKLAAALSALEK